MAFCPKGHEYDTSQHASCPHCGASKPAGKAPPTQYEGDDGPPPAGPGFNPQPRGPIRRGTGNMAPIQPPSWRYGAQPGAKVQPWMNPQMGGAVPAAGGNRTVLEDEVASIERLMGFIAITDSRQDDEHRYFRLGKGVNAIGQFGSRASIELRDPEVSRQHALVICTNKATRLVDLDSTNGVKVDGELREIAVLQGGERITIGRTELVYVGFPFEADY